ncbi:uncharacterized protein EAF02_008127 [Botrytis sinoallii]|uniref:uncharacterized protein n=1 Tax=Botrytis sinoallii TaxID=1463999 RepID=UPI0018FFAA4C|nr:uncharacterized protein EAF02_008127 [Botrytis sinoallii]KAF7876907.1 hypothetical protein EAF02_008127 [Botrytis sinoallii]
MKSTSPTRTRSSLSLPESLFHLSLTILCLSLLLKTLSRENGEPLIASLAFSGLAFSATYSMIRWLGPTFMKAGLKGKDMSKRDKKEIPETMGAVCAVVYLLIIIVFIPFPFYKDIVAATSGGGNRDVVREGGLEGFGMDVENGRFLHRFPHSKLASYLSAVLSLQSVVIIGIGDDLFDIRWRHKFFIPAIASIPILIVYFVDFGVTQIVIPIPLQPYLGELFQLGPLYYIYMASIAIFCPNSINILAGINGIEVSQSLIIAFLLVLNDTLYLLTPYPHPATDLPPLLPLHAPPLHRRLPRPALPQLVPLFRLRRRHLLLFRRHGLRHLRHPRPLLQNPILPAHPPNLQFPLQRPPTLPPHPLSPPPSPLLQHQNKSPRTLHHPMA